MNYYIIGMAKSFTNKKGNHYNLLKQNYYELVMAISNNEQIKKGYFLVYDESIKSLIELWLSKSILKKDELIILTAKGSEYINWQRLYAEKEDHRNGNNPEADKELAISKYGGPVFEELLKRNIEELNEVTQVHEIEIANLPSWDYLGKL